MCDLCSLCTENNKKNFDIVKVTWSRVRQSWGGQEELGFEVDFEDRGFQHLSKPFSMNIMTEIFFSKFTKLFLYL